jgi:hypothetical protein
MLVPRRVATTISVAGFFALITGVAVLILAATDAFTRGPASMPRRPPAAIARVVAAPVVERVEEIGDPAPPRHARVAHFPTPKPARESASVAAKKNPPPATRVVGPLRRFPGKRYAEAGGMYEPIAAHNTLFYVAAPPPVPLDTVVSSSECYRRATAALTPRINCVFDARSKILRQRGHKAVVVGITTEPDGPVEREHCDIKAVQPA